MMANSFNASIKLIDLFYDMKNLDTTICLGIGDNLVVRMCLDMIKHNYQCIRVSHNKMIMREFRNNDPKYADFMNQLGRLLFSDPPYQFVQTQFPEIHTFKMINELGVLIKKPSLDHLLCKGTPLSLNEPYIIITTKVRVLPRKILFASLTKLWRVLNALSDRYRIVIMGERIVEESKEYKGVGISNVYSIYEQIIANIPSNRILDLTVPALGIRVPELDKMQHDCTIMKNAKAVITFGIGGNLWLAAAVANVIGFRSDNDGTTDLIANPTFNNLFLTKNWDQFIKKLEEQ